MASKLIKGNELHLYGAVGGDITWAKTGWNRLASLTSR